MSLEDEDDQDKLVPSDVVDWRQWPIAGVVAKRLGVSKRELAQMVAEQEIVRYRAKDGTWRFDPKDVAAIVTSSRIGQRDMAAAELDPVVVSGERPTRGPEAAALSAIISGQNKMIEQLQDHLAKVMDLAVKPAAKALEVLETTCSRLSSQNETLANKLRAQTELAETASSESFYREIAARELTASEKRKGELFDVLIKKAGPVLVAKAAGLPVNVADLMGGAKPAPEPKPTNGHNGPNVAQAAAVYELLTSLSPEILSGLREVDGIFTDRQKQLVAIITGAAAEATPQPEQPQKEETANA